MARVPDTLFTNFTDGQTVHASDYTREREIMRTAINDTDNRVTLMIPVNAQEVIAKVPVLEAQLTDIATSAKKEGAIGDGVVDDFRKIQDALNKVKNQGGGVVLLPTGIYKTTQTLVIPNGVSLKGSGTLDTQIYFYGSGDAVSFEVNAYHSSIDNILIERKGIKAGTVGFHFQKNLFCNAKDVRVNNFATGYKIDGLDGFSASNSLYNPVSLGADIGILITATGDQNMTNHTNVFGGYVVGNNPAVAGTKGIVIEKGDTNSFFGTAVEDYDIGIHFISMSPGGNSVVNLRTEGCNTDILTDIYSYPIIINPYVTPEKVQNNAQRSLFLTDIPLLRGQNIYWDNAQWLKFKDDGGSKKDVMGVTNTNDTIIKPASFYNWNKVILQVADSANIFKDELTIGTEEVKVRRNLKLGTLESWEPFPTADATQRGRVITKQGGTGVADKVCVCVKKADDTYGWYDKISATYV